MYKLYICVLALSLLNSVYGAYKTKCEVVAALRAQGVPDSDMRDWLCLVKHESNYEYGVVGALSPDYGIFQLNHIRCDNPSGTTTSICWRLRTFGCADSCSSFLDSDISNDASCAVRIKNCDGFVPWRGHGKKCTPSEKAKSIYDFSGC